MSNEQIEKLFQDFNDLSALIIGDVMVDAYYWGKVERISPEAPVPIVAVEKKERRLGGAANVALNIQALGAKPILCSIIGKDDEGLVFREILKNLQLTDVGIIASSKRRTTQKTRIIGNNHQMLRVDSEDTKAIEADELQMLLNKIEDILERQKVDVLIFEDYDKGCINKELISKVVEICVKAGIPTCVDPKKNNFLEYRDVSLFKPNLKELKEGLKMDFDKHDKAALEKAIKELRERLNNKITLITLSELGVFIQDQESKQYIAAHQRDISDVSGAGDTVISVAALCLALNQKSEDIAGLSNLAGGLVCEKVGVVPIDKKQLLQEAKELLAKGE